MQDDADLIHAIFSAMEGGARLYGSDMAAHMPTLYLLARRFTPLGKIVELGSGYSTVALLTGALSAGGELYSYDINKDRGETVRKHLGIKSDDSRLGSWKFSTKDSIESAKDYSDGSVSMMFLDTVHTLEMTRSELDAWFPKIHQHGIICGHDYYLAGAGVAKAVEEFVSKHRSRFRLQVQPHDQGLFILWPFSQTPS